MKVTWSVKGYRSTVHRISAFSEELKLAYKKVVADVAGKVLLEAKAKVPVDTGTLRGSIKSKSLSRWGIIGREVGTKLGYARFVEFGTKQYTRSLGRSGGSRQRAGFLYPAARRYVPYYRRQVENEIRKQIAKENAKN